MNQSDQAVIDKLSRDLDEIEKTSVMVDGYARVTPYIVEHSQAGMNFKFIVYHAESKSWFDVSHQDAAMITVKNLNMVREDDVVFDLGCNSGYQTAWFALLTPRGHVHSFDPFPWNTAATKAQAAINGCSNVTTHTVGIGDSDISIVTDLTSSKTFNPMAGREDYPITIQIKKPDHYLKYNPTFIKIDIEGAEHQLGNTSLLSHWSLERGYVEMHTAFIEAGGGKPEFFLDRLVASGFKVLDHKHKPTIEFAPVIETAYYFSRPKRSPSIAQRAKAAAGKVFG